MNAAGVLGARGREGEGKAADRATGSGDGGARNGHLRRETPLEDELSGGDRIAVNEGHFITRGDLQNADGKCDYRFGTGSMI